MNSIRGIAVLGFVVLALARATPAEAQAELAAGVGIENIVADLKKGLEELINDAEAAYSRQAFDTRSHALIVLQNLDTIASGLVGKTFDHIDASQQKFFQDANNILVKWNQGNHDLAKDFDDITTTIEETVSRLPWADKTPLVKSYSPSYLGLGSNQPTFSVKVAGVKVGSGEPTLKFGSTSCALFSHTDRDIEFRCPSAILGNGTAVEEHSGNLEVVAPKGFWDWILFREARMPYRVGIIGIPAVLGKYTLRAVVPMAKVETQERSQYFDHTNAHCSGKTPLNWIVNASDGWKIIESSVRTKPTSVASGNTGPNAESISSSGFRVTGLAVNSGNCTKVFGQTVSKDGRGWVKGYAYWTEQRTVVVDGTVDVSTGSIQWGSDRAETLPDNSKAFILTIERVDGTQRVVTSAGPYDRYDVVLDTNSQTVVVHPKALEAALGT